MKPARKSMRLRPAVAAMFLATIVAAAIFAVGARADRPYAPTRDYDLQNVRVDLRFDLDQRKVIGQVTHTLSSLRDGLTHLDFDCEDLTISSARVNGQDARFELRDDKLIVDLAQPAKMGQKFDVQINYEGKPAAGLYFILPDRDNPSRPPEIWTQGEAEDTHHYIPIYDYPNNRTTFDMILTVPADWLTISNGKLVSTTDAPGNMKTWTWRQSLPVPTYLISFVAGQYSEKQDMWRNIPVDDYVPHGKEDTFDTFARTSQMLDFFSQRFGVPFPWDKYDQTTVDDFVASGMENVSATTLATRDMIHAPLAGEQPEGADNLLSHELTHSWFGDLVTCKDWTNTWLNEGFATFGASLWEEHYYGIAASSYRYWRDQNNWMNSRDLYSVPILDRDITDSDEYVGNVYDKAGWVVQMLREKLGDDAFFAAMQHYLQTYRLQDVVTADLIKAVEESSGVNVDQFFDQWIIGAGAPRFQVRSTYDAKTSKVSLDVKQTQKVEGPVGLFHVPIDVAITTSSGEKSFPIDVSKADETFTFATDGQPLMILFDKSDKILKSVDFQKTPEEWIRQLQTATDVPDRADAAVALGNIRDNDAVAKALGEAAEHDRFWGVRDEALRALGNINSQPARKQVLSALSNEQPWVRQVDVQQLGRFSNDNDVTKRLQQVYRDDKAYSVRGAALQSLAQIKAPGTAALLTQAVATDSPGDVLRSAALRAMGVLGDDSLTTILLDWSSPGKPSDLRSIAIESLGRVDRKNHDLTARLIAYLNEPSFDIRYSAIFALGRRGDPSAIESLQALLDSGQLSLGVPHAVQGLIDELKAAGAPHHDVPVASSDSSISAVPVAGSQVILDRLDKLETEVTQIDEELHRIETAISNNASGNNNPTGANATNSNSGSNAN